ncbi:hypothetical protein PMKS-003986 [Pichia membranifaciens]|uniref:Uncharacterized protein n=1 Tax=Pichia membranifaciens TaxID=4926 RepID=A0A1Q2YLP3_9ASCO|nr:hypothetical protein PMKS-003986 [Pichia membranifaciens]
MIASAASSSSSRCAEAPDARSQTGGKFVHILRAGCHIEASNRLPVQAFPAEVTRGSVEGGDRNEQEIERTIARRAFK